MKQDISCVFEGVAGVGGIYISNLKAAQNLALLNTLGIKAIVTAVRNGIVEHDKSDITDHLYVPADDNEAYNLARHFDETYNFIDAVRKKTNVLVHCYAGISRSATIVIAYLLRKYNYSLEKVITMVKRRRNKINPNRGFIQQLKKEAGKMGIEDSFGEAVEDALEKRVFSPEKKRSLSTYSPKKYKNQKMIDPKQEIINFYRNNSMKFEDKSNVIRLEKSAIVMQNAIKSTRQNLSLNKITKNPPQNVSSMNEQVEGINLQRQQSLILQQKIEKLKSKVLQSQRRRRSQQKRPFSELIAHKTVHQKPRPYPKPQITQIETLLSTKLPKESPLKPSKAPSSPADKGHINKISFGQSQTIF